MRETKRHREIIADNLSKAGFNVGWVCVPIRGARFGLLMHTATTGNGYVVRADEKLTAFVELERAIHDFAVELIS